MISPIYGYSPTTEFERCCESEMHHCPCMVSRCNNINCLQLLLGQEYVFPLLEKQQQRKEICFLCLTTRIVYSRTCREVYVKEDHIKTSVKPLPAYTLLVERFYSPCNSNCKALFIFAYLLCIKYIIGHSKNQLFQFLLLGWAVSTVNKTFQVAMLPCHPDFWESCWGGQW